ncbi:hypothetical protein KI387_025317, partial [Taxus chinensis]
SATSYAHRVSVNSSFKRNPTRNGDSGSYWPSDARIVRSIINLPFDYPEVESDP